MDSFEVKLLERILGNTNKYLHDLEIYPNSEAELHKYMYPVLCNIFPSTVKKPVINHIDKN
jgi:hypothetical protein